MTRTRSPSARDRRGAPDRVAVRARRGRATGRGARHRRHAADQLRVDGHAARAGRARRARRDHRPRQPARSSPTTPGTTSSCSGTTTSPTCASARAACSRTSRARRRTSTARSSRSRAAEVGRLVGARRSGAGCRTATSRAGTTTARTGWAPRRRHRCSATRTAVTWSSGGTCRCASAAATVDVHGVLAWVPPPSPWPAVVLAVALAGARDRAQPHAPVAGGARGRARRARGVVDACTRVGHWAASTARVRHHARRERLRDRRRGARRRRARVGGAAGRRRRGAARARRRRCSCWSPPGSATSRPSATRRCRRRCRRRSRAWR